MVIAGLLLRCSQLESCRLLVNLAEILRILAFSEGNAQSKRKGYRQGSVIGRFQVS